MFRVPLRWAQLQEKTFFNGRLTAATSYLVFKRREIGTYIRTENAKCGSDPVGSVRDASLDYRSSVCDSGWGTELREMNGVAVHIAGEIITPHILRYDGGVGHVTWLPGNTADFETARHAVVQSGFEKKKRRGTWSLFD